MRPSQSNACQISQQVQVRLCTDGRLLMSELGAPVEGKIGCANRIREIGQSDGEQHQVKGQNGDVRQCKGIRSQTDEGALRQARHPDHLVSTVLTFIERHCRVNCRRCDQWYASNAARFQSPSGAVAPQ